MRVVISGLEPGQALRVEAVEEGGVQVLLEEDGVQAAPVPLGGRIALNGTRSQPVTVAVERAPMTEEDVERIVRRVLGEALEKALTSSGTEAYVREILPPP